jgi:hypothetical protein
VPASLTHLLITHCSYELFFSLLFPSLVELVGAGEAKKTGFTYSHWFCERRREER